MIMSSHDGLWRQLIFRTETGACKSVRACWLKLGSSLADEGAMIKLMWRVALVAELETSMVPGIEAAQIERDEFAVPETFGPTLREGKHTMTAVQAEMGGAQVAAVREWFRWCEHCGAKLLSKDRYPRRFRSLSGEIEIRLAWANCLPLPCKDGGTEELRGVNFLRFRMLSVGPLS